MLDSNLNKSCKLVGCMPQELIAQGMVRARPFWEKSGENGQFARRFRENKEYNNMQGSQFEVEKFSWEPLMASLLGLLAKIKCSICSYQLNIWYGTHWVPHILWLIFGSRLRKRGLPPPSHGLSRYCTTSEYGPFLSGKLLKKQKMDYSLDVVKLCVYYLTRNFVALEGSLATT